MGDNSSITIKNCLFDGNRAPVSGGGLGYFASPDASVNSFLEIDSCHFTQNSTQFNGSGVNIGLWGEESGCVLKNSTFIGNNSGGFATAGIWGNNSASSGNVEVANCRFEQNTSTYSAGLEVGCGPGTGFFSFAVNDCIFIGNHALEIGGGLTLYGDSPCSLTAENCYFSQNSSGISGGALLVATNQPEFEARVSNCILENNTSPIGAGVIANNFTENPGMTLAADIIFENCLLRGNSGDGTVGMYNIGNMKFLNCTIADNPAGGIRQSGNSSFTLQNTILANTAVEYQSEGLENTFISKGGNLVLDNSLNDFLTDLDKPEMEPDFIPDTFKPAPTSPLINGGVNDGVTAMYDLAGMERIQEDTVDIGAYECPCPLTTTQEVIIGELGLSPNPATDYLYLQLANTFNNPLKVNLFDSEGRLVRTELVRNGNLLQIGNLPIGVYTVKVVIDGLIYVGKFVKV